MLSAPASVGVKLTAVAKDAPPLSVLVQEVDGVTVAVALVLVEATKASDGAGLPPQLVSLSRDVTGLVVVDGLIAVPTGEGGTITLFTVTWATVSPAVPSELE